MTCIGQAAISFLVCATAPGSAVAVRVSPLTALLDPASQQLSTDALAQALASLGAKTVDDDNDDARAAENVTIPSPYDLRPVQASLFGHTKNNNDLATTLETNYQQEDESDTSTTSNVNTTTSTTTTAAKDVAQALEEINKLNSLIVATQTTLGTLSKQVTKYEEEYNRRQRLKAAANTGDDMVTIKLIAPNMDTTGDSPEKTEEESDQLPEGSPREEIKKSFGDDIISLAEKHTRPVPVLTIDAEPSLRLADIAGEVAQTEFERELLRLSEINGMGRSNLDYVRKQLEGMEDSVEGEIKFLEADSKSAMSLLG